MDRSPQPSPKPSMVAERRRPSLKWVRRRALASGPNASSGAAAVCMQEVEVQASETLSATVPPRRSAR